MTPHSHREFVPGCYRCDLSRDEATPQTVESVRVGTVCVVQEWPVDNPKSPFLYGIFTTEAAAREDYGEIDGGYGVTFDVLPLWSAPTQSGSTQPQKETR